MRKQEIGELVRIAAREAEKYLANSNHETIKSMHMAEGVALLEQNILFLLDDSGATNREPVPAGQMISAFHRPGGFLPSAKAGRWG